MKQYISRVLTLAAVAGAMLWAPAALAADPVRIGFVNTDRLLRDAVPAKAAQTKLEAEFSRREKEIDDAGLTLKTASERFEREAPTMSESQRQTRQRQLMDQDREFQRKRREFQEDLTQRRNEELAAVVERANRAIKQIFDAEKYDLILQEVVFAGPRVDITEKVIRALNGPAPAGK